MSKFKNILRGNLISRSTISQWFSGFKFAEIPWRRSLFGCRIGRSWWWRGRHPQARLPAGDRNILRHMSNVLDTTSDMRGSNNVLPAKTHNPREPQTEERAFGYYLLNFDSGTKLENRTVTVRLSFSYLKVR